MREKAIILLSGGIDSSTLLAKMAFEKYEITAVSFLYNQKNNIEIEYAKKNAKKYNVLEHFIFDLPQYSFGKSSLVNRNIPISKVNVKNENSQKVNSYVPFRNMIFLSFALSTAEMLNIQKIFFAINLDDFQNYWDCSQDFVNQVNKLSKLNTLIEIITPFINMTKKDIIILANKLNLDLSDTISCYAPIKGKECGECLSCKIKKDAIKI